MRPLRLELEAFGPFVERTAIAFERLAADALFSIDGPTGVGKTTLLDAIVYALFEKNASAEAPRKQRSDLAPIERRTEVVFEFALRQRRYRVRRAPAQPRIGRGGKPTEAPAEAQLFERREEAWAPLAEKSRETTAAIEALLGVSVDAFRQIAILPQGEFRKLLLANSKDREEILARLFAADELADFEAFLEAERKRGERAIELAFARRSEILRQAEVEDRDGLFEKRALSERELDTARVREAAARARDEEARRALEAGQNAAARLAAVAEAESRASAARERAEERGALEARLERAGRAAAVDGSAEAFDRARALALERAEEAERRARALALERERVDELEREADWLAAARASVARALSARETAAGEELARAEEAVREARALRRARVASSLASELVEGEPCPVCGARDHPDPARGQDEAPDRAALTRLEQARDGARAAAARAEREREHFLELSIAFAEPSRPIAVELDDPARWRSSMEKRERALAAARKAREAAELEARRSEEAREDAEAAFARARAEFDAALAAAGFADRTEYLAARLPSPEQEAARAGLRAIDDELARASALLDRAREQARDVARPDLDALAARAQQASEERDRAQEARARGEGAASTLSGLARHLDAIETEIERRERAHGPLARIANAANGKNPRMLSFRRYVLGALLDDALDAASRRLAAMSRGRYALRRAAEPRDRRRLAGLDLEVEDSQSGVARPAASLSGGESFLAALALALGMADCAARRAGGAQLDCLFVDEGFGALDPEALDRALAALSGLRAAGKLIGVISHVSEIKEWIPARLEVRTGASGATARFVGV